MEKGQRRLGNEARRLQIKGCASSGKRLAQPLSFARGWPEPETTATGNRSVSPLTELAERLSCSRRILNIPAAVPPLNHNLGRNRFKIREVWDLNQDMG